MSINKNLEEIRARDTVILNCWRGEWYHTKATVQRLTKTLIIVKWGNGERRFNRKTGCLVPRSSGLANMTDARLLGKEE
jgi:hypothetical protein